MRRIGAVPDILTIALLGQEEDFPFVIAERPKVTIIRDVKNLFPRTRAFALEQRRLVVAV